MTTVSIAPNGRLIGLFSDDPGLVDEINEEISDMVLPCAQSDCYIAEPHSHDTSTCEPLSSIPDLIEMIRRERDELRELRRAAEERIPCCGHRKIDWDDSYGGCVACSALAAMQEIDAIRRERDLLSEMVATRDGFIQDFIAERNAAWTERDEWKARAEAAEDRLRPRDARVEPPPDTVTPVLLHVAMGMGQTWVSVTLANDGFERMWFSLATTRVYLMDESPYWLPMPPTPAQCSKESLK